MDVVQRLSVVGGSTILVESYRVGCTRYIPEVLYRKSLSACSYTVVHTINQSSE